MKKTYGKLKLFMGDGIYGPINRWQLSDMPPHVVIKFKHLFPKIKQSAVQPFHIDNNDETCCDLEWFHSRYPFDMSDGHRALMQKRSRDYREFQEENMRLISGEYTPPAIIGFKDGKELKDFQLTAVALFNRVKRLLIADVVGLGKTVEALGGLMNPDTLPALVVVQSHLPDQWCDKIEEFTSLDAHAIKITKPYKLIRKDIIVIKYTNIAKWIDVLAEYGFKTMVLDEVQEVRRLESQKHEACKTLADNMEYVLGLSGTPIVNYGNETYNLFTVIDPTIFPNREEFSREWLSGERMVNDPQALGAYLKERCSYIRRTKSDVGYKGEPPNKIVHTVDFDKKAIDEMQDRAKVLAHAVLQGSFVERGQASRELSIMVRKATGVSKAKYVAEYVRMILENDEKVLLAVWHRDVYDIITEELKEYNPVWYSGTESENQKNASKEAFINGDSKIMLISLRSAVGLDGLQECCSYVVFGEFDWTGAMHEQVIGRLDRYGQTKQVTAIFLASDSGSDPIVMDIIGMKKSQQDGIMNPFGVKEKNNSDDTIIKSFAQKLLNG